MYEADSELVLFNEDGYADDRNADRRDLHKVLGGIIEKAKVINEVIDQSYLLDNNKTYLKKQVAGITSIASQRADSQGDDILDLEEQINSAKERLEGLEKKVRKAAEKAAEKAIVDAIEQIKFYTINCSIGDLVGQRISDIAGVLEGEESLGFKIKKLGSEKPLMDLIGKQNNDIKEMAAEQVVNDLKIEVDNYIKKKESNSSNSEKLELAKQMQQKLNDPKEPSSVKKLIAIKSILDQNDTLLYHTSSIKRKTENFFDRVEKFLDGFFKKKTASQSVPEKSTEKSRHTSFMFFAPPDSRKLVANMSTVLETFERRVAKIPSAA